MDKEPARRQGRIASAGERLRLYLRWWVARGWNSPRAWRAIGLGVAVLALLLVVFRQPLADRFWPEPRIQQLLDEGHQALRQGRLSAADGSGARERFEAAAALDPDRREASDALVATGRAALELARQRLAEGDRAAAGEALELARQLQMPAVEIERIASRLRPGVAGTVPVDALLQQAEAAQARGDLDDGPDSALPLYQRVLAVRPDHMRALEGRDAALSELLNAAARAADAGELAGAARLLQRVEAHDPGHADLPAVKAMFNAALEQRRRQGERDLVRGRLPAAAAAFRQVLAVGEDPAARQGLQRLARVQAQEAVRLAGDFRFEQAAQALEAARELAPDSTEVAAAEQVLARARAGREAMDEPLAAAERERRLQRQLRLMAEAEARQHWLLPPGSSAYDHFKAAQALAPRDARVREAAARILPAARACMDEHLRGNRVNAARGCLDAWQALAPADSALPAARRRLAQRWIAVGSERLGMGDTAFATRALQQARELDAETPELAAFAERLHNALPR